MGDVLFFLGFLALAVVVGVQLGFRAARREQRLEHGAAEALRGIDIDRAAEMAETTDETQGWLR